MATSAFDVSETIFPTAGVRSAYITPLRGAIEAAAAASLESFNKHIAPHVSYLKLAIRFNVCVPPVAPREFDAAFFGIEPRA
jgi:hypothetical protein